MEIKEDIFNNLEQHHIHKSYAYDNMSLCLDIGKKHYQEDSGLIYAHPINDKYKIMAVADGIGSLTHPEFASHIAILTFLKWFLSLNRCELLHERDVVKKMYDVINSIDINIINKFRDKSGTTLLVALILEDNTYVFSVGDSKVFLFNGNKKIWENAEDSYAREVLKNTEEKENLLRFYKSRIVTDYIGYYRYEKINYGINVFKNNEYDRLLLFSDGVSDFFTIDELAINMRFNADDYVLGANNKIIINKSDKSDRFYDKIIGGTDNMTAAVLKKR